ncbi:hypothetical protein PG996_012375 [Apiospora saccharicola]|uniref:Rhodopsin domain-containing protein n=1 Tax=Apiospora saccharicola TaxID=335842 RepID=A0ABR1U559_9PEZI
MDPNQPLNWTLINEMAATLSTDQRDQAEWRIRNTGKIRLSDFQMAIGSLFALASLAFFGRITIRVWSRRRIYLDDGLLILGYICLVLETAIFYKRARMIYLVFSLMRREEVVSLIATQEIQDVYNQMYWSFCYITFIWTTIYAVKLCYFAFFRTLLSRMPKPLIRYYWVCVAFTIIAWAFCVLQQLINCPHFGQSSSKCFPTLPISDGLLSFTYWIGPVLDALTDAAIVSIPILVLRKSQMALLTKIGLSVFLCLSLFMLACSVVRAAGMYYHGTLDTPWGVFWCHTEACIGVLMASITAYRTVLIGSGKFFTRFQQYVDKVIHMRAQRSGQPLNHEKEVLATQDRFGRFLLSKIPSATLTGLSFMLAESTRAQEANNYLSATESAQDVEETAYHSDIRIDRSTYSAPAQHQAETSHNSHQVSWNAPSSWTATAEEAEEQHQPPGRVAAFFLRCLFPPAYRQILQHRAMGSERGRSKNP